MLDAKVYYDENNELIRPTRIPDFNVNSNKQFKFFKTFGGGLFRFNHTVDVFGFPCVLKQSKNKKFFTVKWNLQFVDGTIAIIHSKISLESEMQRGCMFLVSGKRDHNVHAWNLIKLYVF